MTLTPQEARTLATRAARWWPICLNAGAVAEAEYQRADAEMYSRIAEKIETRKEIAA